MDLESLPFVRSFKTVSRSAAVDHKLSCPTPAGSSHSHSQELGHRAGLQLGLTPGLLEGWSRKLWSLQDLPHPSKLGKRKSHCDDGKRARGRKRSRNDDRPDVFQHLEHLKRKQHSFVSVENGQEVPTSPQFDADTSFSFHGNDTLITPTKTPSKTRLRDPPPRAHQALFFSNTERVDSVPMPHSTHGSWDFTLKPSVVFVSETETLDQSFGLRLTENERENSGAKADVLNGEQFSTSEQMGWGETCVSGAEESFSVPVGSSKDTEGMAEVPSFLPTPSLASSPSNSSLLCLNPIVSVPEETISPQPPCSFDPTTFSITNFFPREE